MTWRDLLQAEDERVHSPWLGGHTLRFRSRRWKIKGNLPEEPGFFEWKVDSRTARLVGSSEEAEPLESIDGYAVGDRFVPDNEGGDITSLRGMNGRFSKIHVMESLDHFERVSVSRYWEDGPLLFQALAFPLGPEDEVREAYLDKKTSLSDIKEVTPALDLCFRMSSLRRIEADRRRVEAAARALAEERRIQIEEQRSQQLRDVQRTLGDGELRRQLAKTDFESAARAALSVGGAEYVEHRHIKGNEYSVRYTIDGGRYECVCNTDLHIVEAGVCLTDENTGEKGDTYFTLESLPGVVLDAVREDAVIYRRW